jgi:hypothetical protein
MPRAIDRAASQRIVELDLPRPIGLEEWQPDRISIRRDNLELVFGEAEYGVEYCLCILKDSATGGGA